MPGESDEPTHTTPGAAGLPMPKPEDMPAALGTVAATDHDEDDSAS